MAAFRQGPSNDLITGVTALMFYLFVYTFMNLGVFGVIIALHRREVAGERLDDLNGLFKKSPAIAVMMLIFLLSLAGIPPTVGFYAKLAVLQAVLGAGHVWLALVAVRFALLWTFYYIRIVKLMYFDEPAGSFDRPLAPELKGVLFVTAMVTLFFILLPGPIVGSAEIAAASLFRAGYRWLRGAG